MKKICLITGATSGIGLATAKEFVKTGHTLLLVGRNSKKGEALLNQLKQVNPKTIAHYFTIDLASQKNIREVGAQIQNQFPQIDIVFNNAGVWTSELALTPEGIEMQFGVNHIGHFLLTHLLYPSLVNSPHARLLVMSSESYKYGKLHFDDFNLTEKYHGLKAYGQSKLANLLFAYEFERRKLHDHISTLCVSPGLVKTDIGVKHTNPLHSLAWKLRRLGGKSTQKAAQYIVSYAFEKDPNSQEGIYWENGKPKTTNHIVDNVDLSSRLWEKSLELTNIENYFYSS